MKRNLVDTDMLSKSDFLIFWLRKIREDGGLMIEQANDEKRWWQWSIALDIDVISGADLAKIVLLCDSLNLTFILYNKDNHMNLYIHLNKEDLL